MRLCKGCLVTLWGIALPTGVLSELTWPSELMGLRLHPLFSDRPPFGPVRSFHSVTFPCAAFLLLSFSHSLRPSSSLFLFSFPFSLSVSEKSFPPERSLWFSTFPHESSFIKQRARPRGKSLDGTMAENSTAIGEKSDPCCPFTLSYLTPPFYSSLFHLFGSRSKRIVVLLFDWKGASPFVNVMKRHYQIVLQ